MVDALLEQATCLTPTSVFLLLNVVIAAILISSAFSNHRNPPKPSPSPSLFPRVTSFNFSNYYPDTATNDNDNENVNNDEDRRSNVNLHRHYHSSPSFFSRLGSFIFSVRADGTGPDGPETQEEERPDQSPDDAGQGRAQVRMTRAGPFLSRAASFTYRRPRGPHGEAASNMGDSNNNIDKNNDNTNNSDSGKKVEKAKKKKTKKKAEKATTETTTFGKKEEEVDAKADDFINSPHGEAASNIGDSNNNIDKNNDNTNNSDSGKKVEKAKKKAEKATTETTTFGMKEEEVDAKADDSINKFKQQYASNMGDSNNNIDKNNDNTNNSDSGKKVEKAKKKKTKKKAEKATTETTTFGKKEEDVDAKADDFINSPHGEAASNIGDSNNNIDKNNDNTNNSDSGKKVEKAKKKAEKATTETTTFGMKEEEVDVDAKADDFINKFKQQQRIESLMRYRKMR